MITIYHNPRCSKSRAACSLVEEACRASGETVNVIEYLKQPLTVQQLADLHWMLGCPILEMVRSNEAEYGDAGIDTSDVTDNKIYEAIAKHPILLQRPIVVRDGRAVIGRPPENIASLIE